MHKQEQERIMIGAIGLAPGDGATDETPRQVAGTS